MKKFNRGFTLIELLVVIFIIGLLASIVVVSVQAARVKARDAKRKADIKELKTAIELYANDTWGYPVCSICEDWRGHPITALNTMAAGYPLFTTYLSPIPQDPRYKDILNDDYQYVLDNPAIGSAYGLKVKFEGITGFSYCKTGANVRSNWWGSVVPMCDF